jgi:DNA-binding response OmpR family regulator
LREAGAILVVAADDRVRSSLREALERAGYLVVPLSDAEAAAAVTSGMSFDAVIVHGDRSVVKRMRRVAGPAPLILLDGNRDDAETIVRALGARLLNERSLN